MLVIEIAVSQFSNITIYHNFSMVRTRSKSAAISLIDSMNASNSISTPTSRSAVSTHIPLSITPRIEHGIIELIKSKLLTLKQHFTEKTDVHTAPDLFERARTLMRLIDQYEDAKFLYRMETRLLVSADDNLLIINDCIADIEGAFKISNLHFLTRLCIHLHDDVTIFSLKRSILKTETREIHFKKALTMYHDAVCKDTVTGIVR